ncbi:MAG: ATP synthase F1 subunit gamma [Desulfobacterales bacterium]
MPTLKEVQTKIGSIKKTKQITKAMNMVAASRLRGAQNAMEGFRPFAGKFAEVLGSLAGRAGEDASPLLTPRNEVKKIHLVLCTSDRGLCGGFNMNLIEKARKFIKQKKEEGKEFIVTNFGKKGRDWCRKQGLQIKDAHLGVVGSDFSFNLATNAGRSLIDGFLAGEWDEVYVVWSNFLGMGKQLPTLQQLLPIPPIEAEEEKDINAPFQAEHLCEPSPGELLGEMLPRNVYIQIHSGLLETSTSEHAARMMAMDNASKACNDMIDELTLLYNKARQAAITADLMDIVGGAEALKG